MDNPQRKLSEIDILSINEQKILLKTKNNKLINRNENEDKQIFIKKRNKIEENLKLQGLEKLEKNVLRNKSLSKMNKIIITNNINNINKNSNINVYCSSSNNNGINSDNNNEIQKEKTIDKNKNINNK